MTRYHSIQSNFVCNKNDSLSKVLRSIKCTKGYPLVVINDDCSLFGVISNGDISNFIDSHRHIDTNKILAKNIANQNPKTANILDKYETIEGYLSNSLIRTIPILDFNRVVKKIATAEKPYLVIGSSFIGEEYPPFLIAEIGVNHNGEIEEAKFLIESAAKSGCHAVKFQHRSKNLYNISDINSFDLGTQYIISEINRTNLSIKELKECIDYAKECNLEVIVTPFDEDALEEIKKANLNLSALKIASCDLTNIPLIKACSRLNLPLIISTGMSFERDISETSLVVRSLMIEHAFLHCNSTYPAPPEDINLSYLSRLKEITKTVVGYSSHDGNIQIPIFSIGHGANILEFHITRSINSKGTDHRASIEINKLDALVKNCILAFKVKGQNNPRKPSQGEVANSFTLGKSFALKKEYKKDEIIKKEDLILISPGHGFKIDQIDNIIGKKFINNKKARSIITPEEIQDNNLLFSKDTLEKAVNNLKDKGYLTGIPVRYHDVKRLKDIFSIPLFEFHMSDRDLSLNPSDYLDTNFQNKHLIVHGVEQFEDGFIFDLFSEDENIIKRSFIEIKKLVDKMDQLRKFFKPSDRLPIVLNLGGFTKDKFLNKKEYKTKLDIGLRNFNQLIDEYDTFEFLPQTMPPFPWHQGGRSFHNVLTSKERLNDFLIRTDCMFCFDISHSYMSCKYFKEKLIDHAKILSSRIKHIHLSDAISTNSEGLEIGEGSIDFINLHKQISKSKLKLFMIPEIWQGHVNNGEKFANSIIRFEELIREVN